MSSRRTTSRGPNLSGAAHDAVARVRADGRRPGRPPAGATEVVVRATQQWTPTGITVQRGQTVNFSATGKANLGSNVAVPAGSTSNTRPTAAAPIPSALSGALPGRVGNGQPFGIGDQTSVPMPDAGQLFLGDNSDEFHVVVRAQPSPAGQRRR